MKLWFALGSEVPLYRQLCTQMKLAVLAGDLKPGEKLPSTRSLARRFNIHSNTVSSAYRQLEEQGWVESRRGSGVYVIDRKPQKMSPEQVLDVHIAGFFRAVRELGLPSETVRAQVARWLAAPRANHLLLIEGDEHVARILSTELQAVTNLQVRVISPHECQADRKCLSGAVPVCRPSKKLVVQAAVGAGVELLVLPINSALTRLAPLLGLASGKLIAIVSHWPEFVENARTMLLAAGVCAEALMCVDANRSNWTRGLSAANAILCDSYTALKPEIPGRPKKFVFSRLADSIKERLQPHEQPNAASADM